MSRSLHLLPTKKSLSSLWERSAQQLRLSNLRKMNCKMHPLFFLHRFSYYLCFHRIDITPPPTPTTSLVKLSGKKRAVSNYESEDNDVFIPRYLILSIHWFWNIAYSDDFYSLVLQETALRRHVLQSLQHPSRFQTLFVRNFSIRPCMYIYRVLFGWANMRL